MLIVIPIYTGETATAWSYSLGAYQPGQNGITLKQFKRLVKACRSNPEVDDLDPEQRGWYMFEDCFVAFDRLVVIDNKWLPKLRRMSAAALDQGSDSAWYEACAWYNEAVMSLGEQTINFFGDAVQYPEDY